MNECTSFVLCLDVCARVSMCEKNVLTFESKAQPIIYSLIIVIGKLNEEKALVLEQHLI